MPVKSVSTELTEDEVASIAKALADPRRYEILNRIAAGPAPVACADLLEAVPVAPATMSHHVRELDGAGLIHMQREGKFMHYSVDRPRLRAYLQRLKSDLF